MHPLIALKAIILETTIPVFISLQKIPIHNHNVPILDYSNSITNNTKSFIFPKLKVLICSITNEYAVASNIWCVNAMKTKSLEAVFNSDLQAKVHV